MTLVCSKTQREIELLTRSMWIVGDKGTWIESGDNWDLSS